MARAKAPLTASVRLLRQAGVPFSGHGYAYNGGGTAEVAQALGVDEHQVVKTLIMLRLRSAGLERLLLPQRVEVAI